MVIWLSKRALGKIIFGDFEERKTEVRFCFSRQLVEYRAN